MSLALSVTYTIAGGYYTPGFAITVSGISTLSTADSVLVQAVDQSTGATYDVRGIAHAPVSGDTISSTDFEYPYFNDSTGWKYVLHVYDITGASLGSITGSLQTGLQTRTDLSASYPWTTAVLASIQQPALSLPVMISDFAEWDISASILSTNKILGRANPVVKSDTFGGRTGSFIVLSDIELTGIDDSYMIRLLKYNDTLIFQPYYSSANIGNMYFKVQSISCNRVSIPEAIADALRTNSTVMLYTVSFIEVDRPKASTAPFTIISWQDVDNNNVTWQNVKDDHGNWLDVLNNPTA